MREQGITGIDLVAVNLYTFEEQLARTDDQETLIETIDIGGSAMLRASAKNHQFVTVICDPSDYDEVVAALDSNGDVSPQLRRDLAARVFARTARYDAAISGWLDGSDFAETLQISAQRQQTLRYGENPHQQAALYFYYFYVFYVVVVAVVVVVVVVYFFDDDDFDVDDDD